MKAHEEIMEELLERGRNGEKLKLKDFRYHNQVRFIENWSNFKQKIRGIFKHEKT